MDNKREIIRLIVIIAAFLGLGIGKMASGAFFNGAYIPWFIIYLIVLLGAMALFEIVGRGKNAHEGN